MASNSNYQRHKAKQSLSERARSIFQGNIGGLTGTALTAVQQTIAHDRRRLGTMRAAQR